MHVYLQSFIISIVILKKKSLSQLPVPLEILFKSFKGDLWGLSLCQAPCFPHKGSREGHISYNVPALNGVSNSSRKTHSSPLDS